MNVLAMDRAKSKLTAKDWAVLDELGSAREKPLRPAVKHRPYVKPATCPVRRAAPVGPMFGCEGCCGVFAECVELSKVDG